MYVAITRAERGLFLTESEGYISSIRSEKFPSRFLREIKKGLVELEGDLTNEQMEELFEGTKQLMEDLDNDINPQEYKVGDKVAHWVFGAGEVIEVTSDNSVKVRFEKGERFIQTNFLKFWDGTEELFKRTKSPSQNTNTEVSSINVESILHIGDVINHYKFGNGVVEKVWGKGDYEKALVSFGEIVKPIYTKSGGIRLLSNTQNKSEKNSTCTVEKILNL